MPEDYEITENTKNTFKQTSENVALYYRDLFAHKLGQTKGELYYLMVLDGTSEPVRFVVVLEIHED